MYIYRWSGSGGCSSLYHQPDLPTWLHPAQPQTACHLSVPVQTHIQTVRGKRWQHYSVKKVKQLTLIFSFLSAASASKTKLFFSRTPMSRHSHGDPAAWKQKLTVRLQTCLEGNLPSLCRRWTAPAGTAGRWPSWWWETCAWPWSGRETSTPTAAQLGVSAYSTLSQLEFETLDFLKTWTHFNSK